MNIEIQRAIASFEKEQRLSLFHPHRKVPKNVTLNKQKSRKKVRFGSRKASVS